MRDAVERRRRRGAPAQGQVRPVRRPPAQGGATGRPRSRPPSRPADGRPRAGARTAEGGLRADGARGSCGLVTVLGAAGIGKSRLVGELLASLGGEAHVAQGRCLPYGEGITYWPVAEAVKSWPRSPRATPPPSASASIAELLAGEDDAELVARKVAIAVGLDTRHGGDGGGPLGCPQALRGGCPRAAARGRLRRRPVGRGHVPRPAGARRGLGSRSDPRRLRRPARARATCVPAGARDGRTPPRSGSSRCRTTTAGCWSGDSWARVSSTRARGRMWWRGPEATRSSSRSCSRCSSTTGS